MTQFEEIKQAAERGDAKAQGLLGASYEGGDGVPKNLALAEQWYRKGAAGGDERSRKGVARLAKKQPPVAAKPMPRHTEPDVRRDAPNQIPHYTEPDVPRRASHSSQPDTSGGCAVFLIGASLLAASPIVAALLVCFVK